MHRIHTSIFISLLIASVTGCRGTAELPSREDCIVMVSADPTGPLERVDPDPDLLVRTSRELSIPVGGTAYGKDGELYLQFSTQCDNREVNAKKLMRAVLGATADGLDYRSTGIVPGPNTIDVMGDAWREKRGVPFGNN